MTKRNSPHSGQRDAVRDAGAQSDPLERLRQQLDAAATAPAIEEATGAGILEWAEKVARSGVLRRVPLSEEALEIVSELTPAASVTLECRTRLERERLAVRDAIRATAAFEAECRVSSPAELFHDLRERAGISAEQSAALFGVTPTTWLAMERKQHPWYQLPCESLPAFADAVRQPVDRLVELITIAARRALFSGVERRANLALGRFDNSQREAEARRDTLRLAFARLQAENRGAAQFLEGARRAAGLRPKEGEPTPHHPSPKKR